MTTASSCNPELRPHAHDPPWREAICYSHRPGTLRKVCRPMVIRALDELLCEHELLRRCGAVAPIRARVEGAAPAATELGVA